MNEHYINDTKLFKALCDEHRLAIIELLQSSEKCACDLLESISISQSTLSHHMKILVESGIVHARKDKKWTYYSLCDEGITLAKHRLEVILNKDTKTYLSCSSKENKKCAS